MFIQALLWKFKLRALTAVSSSEENAQHPGSALILSVRPSIDSAAGEGGLKEEQEEEEVLTTDSLSRADSLWLSGSLALSHTLSVSRSDSLALLIS